MQIGQLPAALISVQLFNNKFVLLPLVSVSTHSRRNMKCPIANYCSLSEESGNRWPNLPAKPQLPGNSITGINYFRKSSRRTKAYSILASARTKAQEPDRLSSIWQDKEGWFGLATETHKPSDKQFWIYRSDGTISIRFYLEQTRQTRILKQFANFDGCRCSLLAPVNRFILVSHFDNKQNCLSAGRVIHRQMIELQRSP